MDHLESTRLWARIENRLTAGLPDWRQRIEQLDQVPAVRAREAGRQWADDEAFRGLVLSVLSSNTDWAKIQRIVPQLGGLFHGFSLTWYASVTPDQVLQTFVPWIRDNGAGSQFLAKDLANLTQAASRLLDRVRQHGSVEAYLNTLLVGSGNDLVELVFALGSPGSQHKLPGLGIALAAEFLKNLGFNVAKPDRHVNRAAGSFGWVAFRTWDRQGKGTPKATPAELRLVIRAMAEFSEHQELPGCFVDNAVWLLCAKSGLGLDNAALAAVADPGT